MDIKKLLFVTRFEELWFDALQSLLELKNADLSHVVFLHVIDREKVAMRRGAGYQKNEEIKLREMANIRFIDWAENLFEQGMEAGVYIVVGNYLQHIITAAEKEESDLIVIGRPKKTKWEKLYSNNDITQMMQRTNRPVLIYKHIPRDTQIVGSPFERPILAVDFEQDNQDTIDRIKKLKNVIKEISVIYVADPKSLEQGSNCAMEVQKTRKTARKKLDDICDIFEEEGIKVKAHVYIGDWVSEVEKAALENRATMIITEALIKGDWKNRWFGTVHEDLAEKSIFPVLLIPLK